MTNQILRCGALMLLCALGGACSSSRSGGGNLELKCGNMCRHLLAAPLSGCGKSDAADQDGCTSECYAHVTPDPDDGELEATEAELDCAITAQTCEAWQACGDFL